MEFKHPDIISTTGSIAEYQRCEHYARAVREIEHLILIHQSDDFLATNLGLSTQEVEGVRAFSQRGNLAQIAENEYCQYRAFSAGNEVEVLTMATVWEDAVGQLHTKLFDHFRASGRQLADLPKFAAPPELYSVASERRQSLELFFAIDSAGKARRLTPARR